jgi:hypothetical protein
VRAGCLLAVVVTVTLVAVGFAAAKFSWPFLPTVLVVLVVGTPVYVGLYALASGRDAER